MFQVKSSVVLPLLRSIGNPEPIVSVTVGGFLFGYEDDLACIGQIEESLTDDDDDSSDDDWDVWEDDDFFFRRKRRSVPNYRDPESGKCLWGVLRDLNNTEHESVRWVTTMSYNYCSKCLTRERRLSKVSHKRETSLTKTVRQ